MEQRSPKDGDGWQRIIGKTEKHIVSETKKVTLIAARQLTRELGMDSSIGTAQYLELAKLQYTLAVKRQFWRWIQDFQLDSTTFLSNRVILEHFPNPGGRNAVTVPHSRVREDIGMGGKLVQDARLHHTDLPKAVYNAASMEVDIPPHVYIDTTQPEPRSNREEPPF